MALAVLLVSAASLHLDVINAGWGDKDIRYTYMVPPANELAGVARIAVMDLEGPYGRVVSDTMVNALGSAREWISKYEWDQTATPQIIEPVERTRLDAVIKEQQLGESGLVDDNGAAKIGQLLGVDAIVLGSTTQDVKDTYEDRKETRTQNNQSVEVVVRYHTRTARLTANARVVQPSTGNVVSTFSNSAVRNATDTVYSNLPNPNALLEQAARQLGSGFGGSFSPGRSSGTARLEKVKSLLKERADRDKRDRVEDGCKTAAEAAESGRLEEAWQGYLAAFQLDEYNDLIANNLGSLYEAIGDYENALKHFKMAQEFNASKEDYAAAGKRVAYEMGVREKLHQLGYIEKRTEFSPSAGQDAITKAATPKLRTRKAGTRLLSEADDGAQVVGNLPKEMTLEIVEEKQVGKDLFYHVKMANGKEGWLAEKDIEKL